MQVPYLSFAGMHNPIKQDMIDAFTQFLANEWFVLGDGVNAFERELASFHDTKYAIGVASGLDAMIIALKVLEIGPGDEVIVPSNTYIATWLAVSTVGARIVPVEPDPEDYNIDPIKIRQAITLNTKAIIPVHLYGTACRMGEIMSIAQDYGLYVVEDNAQAIGARMEGQMTGTFGHVNALSFYPGKNLGALGDAGAILTNDDKWAEKCRSLRNYGSDVKYYNKYRGMNSRLDELQARILSVKLPHLESWNRERTLIGNWYQEKLDSIPGLILPKSHEDKTRVFHIFPIRIQKRNALHIYLKEHGIQTLIHYPVPPHLQEAYSDLGYRKGDFPVAETIADTELSLPIYPGLQEEQLQYVAEKIDAFMKAHA